MSSVPRGPCETGADHRVARDQGAQRPLIEAIGSRWPFGNHEVAYFGSRVPDADLRVRRQRHTEFAEDAARILDHARSIGGALVPGGRQSEYRPWVAAAKRAYHDVVPAGRILQRDHMLTLPSGVAELRNGAGRIAQQSIAISAIHPGARDDASAVARADFGLVGVDQRVERRPVDIALLGQ